MNRAKLMGEAPIPKLLLAFSVPAIVGMMVNALYNVVDRIFIGQGVGALGLAGATIGFPIMNVLMAFTMLIGLGANSLVSIRLGEKKQEEAEHILGNALALFLLASALLTAAGLLFLKPLLAFFGASPQVMPYAVDYVSIILLGVVFQMLGFGMNNFIRGEGNPRIAMATMLIGALLNTILDPLFIFAFGMGIRGAAWATILSQAVSAVWVLSYFLGRRGLLKIHLRNLTLRAKIVAGILAIGSAPFVMQMGASMLNIVLNKQLAAFGGDLAISAMGIVASLMMMILMPIFGLNQGSQPIIGYNFGARRFDRVKRTLQLAIGAATAWVLLGFAATRLFPNALIGLFSSNNPELLALGTRTLRIFLAMLPIVGFQLVSSSYFQAVGKPRRAMFLSLSRQFILLIPALLILPSFLGLQGIWLAGPVSDLGASLVTAAWLAVEIRHLNRRHGEMEAVPAGNLRAEGPQGERLEPWGLE